MHPGAEILRLKNVLVGKKRPWFFNFGEKRRSNFTSCVMRAERLRQVIVFVDSLLTHQVSSLETQPQTLKGWRLEIQHVFASFE
jgi:hypothetical protein